MSTGTVLAPILPGASVRVPLNAAGTRFFTDQGMCMSALDGFPAWTQKSSDDSQVQVQGYHITCHRTIETSNWPSIS